MKITDAQVHIYEPDTPQHPWPREPGRSAAPQKHARGFSPLQMLGAMGGADCTARGEPLSAYENARGTGNIHVWFDTEQVPA